MYVGTNTVSFRGELLLKIDAGSMQTQDSLKLNLLPSHLPETAPDLRDAWGLLPVRVELLGSSPYHGGKAVCRNYLGVYEKPLFTYCS